MLNIFATPSVIQCEGEEINEVLRAKGKTCLLTGPEKILEKHSGIFKNAFKRIAKIYTGFNGECCNDEINRILKMSKPHRNDFIAGFGGGKAIDTAKSISAKTGIPLIVIPTSASTCAAFTSHSMLYSTAGQLLRKEQHLKCPAQIILIREILVSQPRNLLSGGMADATAKYYERTFRRGKNADEAFREFSKEILRFIFTKGIRTFKEYKKEDVLKASKINILHTGLISLFGGQEFHSSLGHAVANGLTQITPEKPELRNVLHGELVGIGILTALFLLKRTDELLALRDLFFKMGVLNSFHECGEIEDNLLRTAAEYAIKSEPLFKAHKIKAVDIVCAVKSLKL